MIDDGAHLGNPKGMVQGHFSVLISFLLEQL